MIKDLFFDVECIGEGEKCIVLDISVIAFDPDPTAYLDKGAFQRLVESGKQFKISVADQKNYNRTTSQRVIDWWKDQSEEAKVVLRPLATDLTLKQAVDGFLEYAEENGIVKGGFKVPEAKKSQLWCRGNSFDLPILKSMIQDVYPNDHILQKMPISFREERDIRTAIESLLLTRGMTETPLCKGFLNGFIHHNSIHDCAKDILMLQHARLYAMGHLDPPEGLEETDPSSVK